MTQHEAEEQTLLIEWTEFAKCKFPDLEYLYHVPNGGSRNKIEAAKLKAQGVKSGVPDLCLPAPKGGYHGLYIEMKYGKNKPSENQIKWLNYLKSVGYKIAVCYGWEQAKDVIVKYLEAKHE